MAFGSLFSPQSNTRQDTEISERTNTLVAEDNARNILNSIGGIKIVGGGKKSNTPVTLNITTSDAGAIDFAERAIGEGFAVTSLALKEAAQSRRDSTDTAFRALDLAEARSGSEGLDLLKSSGKFLVVAAGVVAAIFFIGKKI